MNECYPFLADCGAGCCKQFVLKLDSYNPHGVVTCVTAFLDADMARYMKLHGCEYDDHRNLLILRNREFKVYKERSGRYRFVRRCDFLMQNLNCFGYPDNRPDFCKDMNTETVNNGKYVLTPNCRFSPV